MSVSRTYVFISSDGKIWQKPDLTRDEIVADLKFATLFITMSQGASVSIIEDTLSQVAVDAATKFLTARKFTTPIMVMWWKTHMDWNQNTMPKGERRALVSSEEFASKVRITVRDPKIQKGTGGTFTEDQIRKAARRASPVKDGIPSEFQTLWRQCKIVDGFVTPRMQPLLDRELRFRMGFQIKVSDSVITYTKGDWQINVEYFEGQRGSKVIISKNGTQVTAAPAKKKFKVDPKIAPLLKKFVDAYRAYHTARGATFDMDVATSYKVQDLLNSYKGHTVEYMVAQLGAEIEDLEDDLRRLPKKTTASLITAFFARA